MEPNAKTPLAEQMDFYIANQKQLVQSYNNKILLIHSCKVEVVFDTKTDAFYAGKEKFEPGTFLIIKCNEGDEEYTVNYRTINRFSRLVPACL